MKQCPSFPGYSVNENNEVFSHRTRRGILGKRGGTRAVVDNNYCKKLSLFKGKKGYLSANIRINGKQRPTGIHILVADAYIGPNVANLLVRHLDDNPLNNTIQNLSYGTHYDNAQDRKKNGSYYQGDSHHNAKLSNADAKQIRDLRKKGYLVKHLAIIYEVSKSVIEKIISNKSYQF